MRERPSPNCLHCNEFFVRNPHAPHARYCSQPACRRASKRASQTRWLRQPANRDYFRDPCHVKRVQAWRRAHPGYWRRQGRRTPPTALQDSVALQDLVRSPTGAALLGFFAVQLGTPLQETVAPMFWKMHAHGQALMGMTPTIATKGTSYVSS